MSTDPENNPQTTQKKPRHKTYSLWWWLNLPPVLLITLYRKAISPMFPPSCRFTPSCSTYGLQAFRAYPPHKALWLTIWRILRCNPFNPGGFDPLPHPNKKKHTTPNETSTD